MSNPGVNQKSKRIKIIFPFSETQKNETKNVPLWETLSFQLNPPNSTNLVYNCIKVYNKTFNKANRLKIEALLNCFCCFLLFIYDLSVLNIKFKIRYFTLQDFLGKK